jgi:hypothetical protein
MKKNTISLFCLLTICIASIYGQQVPISLYQLSNPRIFNPANGGAWTNHQLLFLHQQRGSESQGLGWSNISDFISYSSPAIFNSRGIGWGIHVTGDHMHSDMRIGFAPSISASIIQNRHFRWGLGIYGGFSHWRSSFRNVPIFDAGDEIFTSPYNFTELDAGGGTDLSWIGSKVAADLGFNLSQLPASTLSRNLLLNRLVPHCTAYGGVLFEVAYNIRVGPRVFYRNTIFNDSFSIKKGNLDIGLKAEFNRQSMWFAAGYRIHHSGWTGGFGTKIWSQDTLKNPEKSNFAVNLSAIFSVPGRAGWNIGPTAEIGLGLVIGNNKHVTLHDTVIDIGPIWESSANLTRHKDTRLAQGSPPGIVAGLVPLDSHVVITYEFPDDSRSYVGDNPEWAGDSLLARIGAEWVGMDNFIENLMDETVEECLSPELTNVLHKERMDSLKRLMWVQLTTNLKWDRQSATTGPGVSYFGELNPPGHKMDTLVFKVVYDERDTIVRIPVRGHYLNNFELAALKLYAMRKKLEYELERYYAEQNRNVLVAWEDEPLPIHWDVNADEIELKATSLLFILKLRIESDHPKQKPLQLTMVTLKFRRYREGDSRERIYAPREGQVFSDHTSAGSLDPEKKHRRKQRENGLLKREDFVKTNAPKAPRKSKKTVSPQKSPSGGSLDH